MKRLQAGQRSRRRLLGGLAAGVVGGSGFITPEALSAIAFATGVQTGDGLVTITYGAG